jgi:hypothetical protein
MKNALPFPSKHEIEAFAASAALWLMWLMSVVAALGAPRRSRRLHRFVQMCERGVESIILLTAMQRFGLLPRRRNTIPNVRPGFRRQRGAMRLFRKSARIRARGRATLYARIARLIEVMANPERYIAHFLRRLTRGLPGFRPLAAHPPAVACATLASPRAAFADSS